IDANGLRERPKRVALADIAGWLAVANVLHESIALGVEFLRGGRPASSVVDARLGCELALCLVDDLVDDGPCRRTQFVPRLKRIAVGFPNHLALRPLHLNLRSQRSHC